MGGESGARPAARVVVVAAEADDDLAEGLRSYLADAGFAVVPAGGSDGEADAADESAVVVLSPAAVRDGTWRAAVEALRAHPVVPLARGGGLPRDDDPLLAPLRAANWVRTGPGPTGPVFATVAAALRSRVDSYAAIRQLGLTAQAWARAGHPEGSLTGDVGRAREHEALVRAMVEDPLFSPDDTTVEFAHLSVEHALANRRTRRRWYGVAVVMAAVVLALLGWTRSTVRDIDRTNDATVATVADPNFRGRMPEWSALLAASLMLDGDTDQRELGRRTLREQLSRPWDVGHLYVSGERSIEAAVPLADPALAVVVVGTNGGDAQVGVFDLDRVRLLWTVPLDGAFWYLALSPDGSTAVAVGEGVAVVDLGERTARAVRGAGRVDLAAFAGDGDVVALANWTGELSVLDLTTAGIEPVASFAGVLDLRSTDDGGVRAVVDDGPAGDGGAGGPGGDGHLALVDALGGGVLASVAAEPALIPQAGVVPDAEAALFTGADHQLWRLDADGAAPTGLAVPDRSGLVVPLADERVIVGGEVDAIRVRHLPTGADLGEICRPVHLPFHIVIAADRRHVACLGSRISMVSPVPAAPHRADVPDADLEVRRDGVVVEARGDDLRVRADGVDTGWGEAALLTRGVAALALAPDGPQVLVLGSSGEAMILDWSSSRVPVVVRWHLPGGGAAATATWDEAGPVVHTDAGWAWAVPRCDRCATDADLLATARELLPRCWNGRQLEYVDPSTRDELGVEDCYEDEGG